MKKKKMKQEQNEYLHEMKIIYSHLKVKNYEFFKHGT